MINVALYFNASHKKRKKGQAFLDFFRNFLTVSSNGTTNGIENMPNITGSVIIPFAIAKTVVIMKKNPVAIGIYFSSSSMAESNMFDNINLLKKIVRVRETMLYIPYI